MSTEAPSVEGKWRLINPLSIRFSQPRIAPHFRDGHLLDETVAEVQDCLVDTSIEPADWHPHDCAEGAPPYDVVLVPPFPSIRVISWLPKIRKPGGEAQRDCNGDQILGQRAWFALDNRRLHTLQYAAAKRWPRRCCIVVKCIEEVPGGSTMREIRKFRTTTEGKSVEVGVRVGETQPWSWPKAAPPNARQDDLESEGLFSEDLHDAARWAPGALSTAEEAEAVAEEFLREKARSREQANSQNAGGYGGGAGGKDGAAVYPYQNNYQNNSGGYVRTPCPEYGWEYMDPTGKVQGPFMLDKMKLWYNHGYFLPTLPMRCDAYDSFIPFENMFPKPAVPFEGLVMRYIARHQ